MPYEHSISDYVKKLIPDEADILFIFEEDFDGDGINEIIIGYTTWESGASTVLWVHPNKPQHLCILSTDYETKALYGTEDDIIGVVDGAHAMDTNGDGKPELILALTAGNGHFVSLYIFHWKEDTPTLAWRTDEDFAHGTSYIGDFDYDGVYEAAIEGLTYIGDEQIIAACEAGPHVRMGIKVKWDGTKYAVSPHQVRLPDDLVYNAAVTFLVAVWNEDYDAAYRAAAVPTFLGIDGLDNISPEAFTKILQEKVRPRLAHNLKKGLLIPNRASNDYAFFKGFLMILRSMS